MANIQSDPNSESEPTPEPRTDLAVSATRDVINFGRLADACSNFKSLIDQPNELIHHKDKLVRATYFPVSELMNAITSTGSAFIKVYYGVLDDVTGRHFMFIAPVDKTGRATDNETAVLPVCIGTIPPCPKIEDTYIRD